MSLLPTIGTVTYNGVTFNATARSYLRGRPAYDSAGLTVTHVEYELYLDSYIPELTPGGGTAATLADLRRKLSTPGQALTVTGTGLGDLVINVAGAKDVKYGPTPKLVHIEAMGSTQCARVIWSCEVHVPECSNASYQNVPMAFNYETAYEIDADGYTRRIYTGYIEIPATRVAGSRNLPDSAIKYRDRVRVPLQVGFKRVAQTWKLSEDKRRLDWSVVDEELPDQALPGGCTNAGGHFILRSQDMNMVAFTVSLNASYTVAPLAKGGRRAAWDAFYALMYDRLAAAAQRYGQIVTDGQHLGANDGVAMMSFSADEGLYGDSRVVSFEASWVITNGDITDIMLGSGMWRPVPGTDWQRWSTSEGVRQAQQTGGTAQLSQVGQDTIIDLCGGAVTVPNDSSTTIVAEREVTDGASMKGTGWVDYQFEIRNDVDPGVVTMKTLPTGTGGIGGLDNNLKGSPAITPTMTGQGLVGATGPIVPVVPPGLFGPPPPPPDIPITFGSWGPGPNDPPWILTPQPSEVLTFPPLIPLGILGGSLPPPPPTTPTQAGDAWQQRTAPSQEITLIGYGVRIGYRVLCPGLVTYNGRPVVPIKPQKYHQRVLGYLCGVPVWYGEWVLRYRQLNEAIK